MHALHQVGFTTPTNHSIGDRADYRGRFTLSPAKRNRFGFCGTFPCPALLRNRSPLATTLLFGARTFLPVSAPERV